MGSDFGNTKKFGDRKSGSRNPGLLGLLVVGVIVRYYIVLIFNDLGKYSIMFKSKTK